MDTAIPVNQVYLRALEENSVCLGYSQALADHGEEFPTRSPIERIIRVTGRRRIKHNVARGTGVTSVHRVVQVDQMDSAGNGIPVCHIFRINRHGVEELMRSWIGN